MAYTEFSILPPYETLRMDEAGLPLPSAYGLPRWGAIDPPPPIGSAIVLTINNLGGATVTGYFSEGGYLGLRCKLDSPSERCKRDYDGNGHVFGPEFRRAGPEAENVGGPANDIVANLEELGWRVVEQGSAPALMRKGKLVLSGFDGGLPDDHWFCIGLYEDFDETADEPVWCMTDATAEPGFLDCGPAIEMHDALNMADAMEAAYAENEEWAFETEREALAFLYLARIGYDPFADSPDISENEVAQTLAEHAAAASGANIS